MAYAPSASTFALVGFFVTRGMRVRELLSRVEIGDAESRVKLFDLLAAQRIPALVYHLPWPGIGHLAKQGDGFRFFPTPMQLVL